ncbi:MAG: hypothetical protein GY757_27960 [bacterium]|nr:hypothetical protein [bacterium]
MNPRNRYLALVIVMVLSFLAHPIWGEQAFIKEGEYGGGRLGEIHIDGQYAYCAADTSGLMIFDIGTTNPEPVGQYRIPGSTHALCKSGNYVFATNGDSVFIVDVTAPAAPTLAGYFHLNHHVESLVSGDGYIYASGGGGLSIVDCTTPAQPVSLGYLNLPGGDEKLSCPVIMHM